VRDAIVYGSNWAGTGSIQRIALALARVGANVLHCESPRSLLRRPGTRLVELEENLFNFCPVVLGYRLNRIPGISRVQGKATVRQILGHAQALGLRHPIFVYGYAGAFLHPLCHEMKAHDLLLVHVYIDYWEAAEEEHVGLSDVTLAISRTVAHRLRARWGQKIQHIPRGVDLRPYRALRAGTEEALPMLAAIPRPRLGYAGGNAHTHLNTRILAELLEGRREWSFVSFQWMPASLGMMPAVRLPNAHVLPWQSQEQLPRCVAAFDVGFMPYDCSNVVLYNGVPLKLFEYFALGLPVVATPIIYLWDYEDLVYFGETAEELERAVEAALAEPVDSPKRQKRKEVAERHSIEALGQVLKGILG